MTTKMYPQLQINLNKITENAQEVVRLCKASNISVSGVIKGVNGHMGVVESFVAGGCDHIASSRIKQLQQVKQIDSKIETMLLRIPMKIELEEVVAWADISLNSERQTIDWLEAACTQKKQHHGVVLMMDLGDLREGIMDRREVIELAIYVEQRLKWITLKGIGTNLGCYGAIRPTADNLGILSDVALEIEGAIGRPLEIVSGGATSSLPLLLEGKMPSKINNLRIGEGILLNMDLPDIWGVDIPKLNQDTFTLLAQIVEIKEKPSYPIGEIFIDAFGHTPLYQDNGIQKRAILAVGKQDFAMEDKLLPLDPAVSIIGSSSDHLIVSIGDGQFDYQIGDVIGFKIYYGPMLHLCTCEHVLKVDQ